MANDFRRRPRRRGSALEDAILDAVVEILAESGYSELNFEAVAQRAGAGKASIYRRWGTRVEVQLAVTGLRQDLDNSVENRVLER